ncbi:hypothetical protein GJ496_009394 [Pomphorhynchus laevis]|nr:hypothetical protein GJ496_009394 [Pomphorhynchus laevis]
MFKISAVNYIGQNLFQEYCSRKPNDVGNNNINQDILKGIKSLRDNSEILIKKADKGNEPVLWDKEEYIHEGLRQLNSQNYEICKDTALIDAKMAVENLLTKYTSNNTITTETMHELNCRNATPGRMYFLPKTHKNEYPVKGRPIISTNNSPTEKLSKYIDNLMKPLLTKVPSMIRNSGDFLKKLQQIDKDKLPDENVVEDDCQFSTIQNLSEVTISASKSTYLLQRQKILVIGFLMAIIGIKSSVPVFIVFVVRRYWSAVFWTFLSVISTFVLLALNILEYKDLWYTKSGYLTILRWFFYMNACLGLAASTSIITYHISCETYSRFPELRSILYDLAGTIGLVYYALIISHYSRKLEDLNESRRCEISAIQSTKQVCATPINTTLVESVI